MSLARPILAAGLACLVAAPAWAGAWTRDLGSFYGKLALDAYAAGNYAAAGRTSDEGQAYFGWQAALFAEAGLLGAHPVQATVYAPVTTGTILFEGATVPWKGPRATSTRLGDLRVALQTEVTPDDTPIAVAVEAKIPLYSNDTVGADYVGYEEVFPVPGEAQIDLTGWVLAGTAIPDTRLWNDAGIGYQHRTEWFVAWADRPDDLAFADSIVFQDTFGATLGRVIPMLRVQGNVNLASDDVTKQAITIGPQVMVDVVEGIAVEARVAYDVWARNDTQGLGAGVGVSWRQ